MERFKNILVVCCGKRADRDAIERAKWLAIENRAAVTLIDVVASRPGELARLYAALPGDHAHVLEEQIFASHRARLEGLAHPLKAAGVETTEVIREGTTFIEVIGHALQSGCDFIVRSGRSAGDRQVSLDGLDRHLIRKSPVPFLLWRATDTGNLDRVLAVVDPDEADIHRDAMARDVMKLATSLCAHDGAMLDVLNAWTIPEEELIRERLRSENEAGQFLEAMESGAAQSLARLIARYAEVGPPIQMRQVKGAREDIVPDHVANNNIDLVVMASLSRPGVPGYLMDEDVETILNRVGCSILTVKPAGFETPVHASDPAKASAPALSRTASRAGRPRRASVADPLV